MKRKLEILLALFFFNALTCQHTTHTQDELNNTALVNIENIRNEHFILTKDGMLKCVMLKAKGCLLDLLVRNDLRDENLIISSNAENIVQFRSIKTCDNIYYQDENERQQARICSNLNEFNISHVASQINLLGYSVRRLNLDAVLIGKASISIQTKGLGYDGIVALEQKVLITAPRRPIDIVFDIWRWSFGSIISLLMGILLDKESFFKIIKMPKAIAIGFSCQYLFMPLLAFAISTVFRLTPVEALALFIYGCSPGGAGSNNWTILFNGDIDLSVILTFISTCSSLVMMPAWIYSLGRVFSVQASIRIPIVGLLSNLLVTIIPCLIGFGLSRCFPKLRIFCLRIAKPFTLIVLISFFALFFISKFYILKLVKLRNWLSGPLIPWFGYLLGGSVAKLLRLPISQCKTVAIETGIQNVGVAFLIIFTNLPSPEADYAAIPIIAVAVCTTVPLFLLLLLFKVYERMKSRQKNRDKLEVKASTDNVVKENDKSSNVIVLPKFDKEETKPMIKKDVVASNGLNEERKEYT